MKLSASLGLAYLAAGAFAGVVVERDRKTIQDVLNVVQNGIRDVVGSVRDFTGDVGPVKEKTEILIYVIKSKTGAVEQTGEMPLSDAVQLMPTVQGLKADGKALVDELVAKRELIKKAGQCEITRDEISKLAASAASLVYAITQKIPEVARPIAEKEVSGVTELFEQALAKFAPGQC